MPDSWPENSFPNLHSETYRITSQRTKKYNCIAWAAGCTTRKWWPDIMYLGYWPPGAPREESIEAFVAAFEQLGYTLCANGILESGYEKVALFAELLDDGALIPTHAAIQLENGNWSSKLGDFEDIEHHELEAVSGPVYGQPVKYLSRQRLS